MELYNLRNAVHCNLNHSFISSFDASNTCLFFFFFRPGKLHTTLSVAMVTPTSQVSSVPNYMAHRVCTVALSSIRDRH
jgi:hypothetical protein